MENKENIFNNNNKSNRQLRINHLKNKLRHNDQKRPEYERVVSSRLIRQVKKH